jgi:hypothetical protein
MLAVPLPPPSCEYECWLTTFPPVHFDWAAIARSFAMIGSPWTTGIFAHVPALGMPEGIEPSLPPEEASVAPEDEPDEDPDEAPEELPLLPPAPPEEPLLDPELDPDPEPLPDPLALGADPSFAVPPLPDGEPDPAPGLASEPHEAFRVQPTRAMNPIETKAFALIDNDVSTNRADRSGRRRLFRVGNFGAGSRALRVAAERSPSVAVRTEDGSGGARRIRDSHRNTVTSGRHARARCAAQVLGEEVLRATGTLCRDACADGGAGWLTTRSPAPG